MKQKVGGHGSPLPPPVGVQPPIERWKDVAPGVRYGTNGHEGDAPLRGYPGNPVALHIDDVRTGSHK